MAFWKLVAVLPVFIAVAGCSFRERDADNIRSQLNRGERIVVLPAGEIHLDSPLVIPKGANNLVVRASPRGSTLVLSPKFQGVAAIEASGVSNITLTGFAVAGDRTEMKSAWYLPLKEAAFADYYTANGIVVRNSTNVTVRGVSFSHIRGFPIIINATSGALIDSVTITDSGTLDEQGRNNTTGGILFEEGSSRFEVRASKISHIAGNAIWTHSYARAGRQADGVIQGNTITGVARDAIQVGHATRVRVENNRGSEIGFPVEYIDFQGYGTPVAIDTAGNVDDSVYSGNEFSVVNGQCIDLDGFHDGRVTGNTCVNQSSAAAQWLGLHFGILMGNHDPAATASNVTIVANTIRGFAFGGLFLIGEHNTVEHNRFLGLNLARCGTQPVPAKCNALTDQPDALRSGIYLSDDGGRPTVTRDNIIRNNVIEGFRIAEHCIAAKSDVHLKGSTIAGNTCKDTPPIP